MKISKKIKIGLIASSILILTGCGHTHVNEIEKISLSKNNILSSTKYDDLKQDNMGYLDEMTLPAYVGPSLSISIEEYKLLKYSNKNLLFSGYGLRDNIYMLTTPNLSFIEKNKKAKEYGFQNLKQMFTYLYSNLEEKSLIEKKRMISSLKEKNLIQDVSLFNEFKLNEKNKEIYYDFYSPYFFFEQNQNKIDSSWGIWDKSKFITFTENDFKQYTYLITLIDELLKNNNIKKDELYGIY